ncbi:MAG: PIN domain-containing protein [Alphaproteobacteria bacterium]
MILADTSVWVDHLRYGKKELADLLDHAQVLTHPFIIGELAVGHLKPRDQILRDLAELPWATVATDTEVLRLIDRHMLFGSGIGYIDAHLLAAALLTPRTSIWSRDRHLLGAARKLGLTA